MIKYLSEFSLHYKQFLLESSALSSRTLSMAVLTAEATFDVGQFGIQIPAELKGSLARPEPGRQRSIATEDQIHAAGNMDRYEQGVHRAGSGGPRELYDPREHRIHEGGTV